MKKIRTILILLSAIGFCLFVVLLPVSYSLNLMKNMVNGSHSPSDSIPIILNYRLGFENGGVWLYTAPFPYEGGIWNLSSDDDPPPITSTWYLGEYGFGHWIYLGRRPISARECDLPGIYFRRFWNFDANPPYTTLRISLWYPILVLAILPARWISRRVRHSNTKTSH
jgi:hypothetical protein